MVSYMLYRSVANSNEYHGYPLIDDNSVYPDGLISDCCIILDTPDSVYIESAVVSDTVVTLTFSTGRKLSLYASLVISDDINIARIQNIDDDSIVGWVWLGSGISVAGSYSGKVEICPSCIRTHSTHKNTKASVEVNGVLYDCPPTLNIVVSGDLTAEYTDKGIILGRSQYANSGYDSDDINTMGGLISINGSTKQDGTIIIDLPKGSLGSQKVNIFKVTRTGDKSCTVLTISTIQGREHLAQPFTCPDSDILLNTIIAGNSNIGSSEAPLDAFVGWYRNRN